jgi:FkbM family methyltransferase
VLERLQSMVARRGVVGAACYFAGRVCNGLFNPTARQSWAQFGEDLVARDILGLHQGYYVDVGCNDPIRWSNTYLFYLHGWRGLLVDGNRELIDACRRQRPADTAVCCLLGNMEGEGEIAIYDEHALSSAVETHNAERRSSAKLLERRVVPIKTLTQLLADQDAPHGIDFLSIDVEGMDLHVLQGLDLTRYHVRLIAVEDASFDPLSPKDSPLVQYLSENEYVLYSHVHPTLFFIRKGVRPRSFHGPTPGAV